MSEVKIKITYKNKEYAFDYGSEAYIFHAGIYNGFGEKYGTEKLLGNIALVHDCYIKDDNPTPLGSLADYIAEHWEAIQDKTLREILDGFYAEII